MRQINVEYSLALHIRGKASGAAPCRMAVNLFNLILC